jgi:PAS domain S-box-containing protein
MVPELAHPVAALDATPVSLFVVDRAGVISFANAHAERAFGRPRGTLVGTVFEAQLAPECRSAWQDQLAPHFEPGRAEQPPAPRGHMALRTGGEPFPVEVSLGSFGTQNEERVVASIRDLTDQRRAEEAREHLEALLEFAPAFIIEVNSKGQIAFINRTIAPYTRKETIGTSWLQYFPPDRQEAMTQALARIYEKGGTEVVEVNTPSAGGTTVWFESHIAPVIVDGKVASVVLAAQDVSERKRAQAEVLAGRHMALLGTLAAGIAHEINTPVQFVGDSIQFLCDSNRDLFTLIERVQQLRATVTSGAPLDEAVRAAAEAEAEEAADLPFLRENMPKAFDRCVDGLNQVAKIVRSLKEYAHPSETQMTPADLNRAVESSLTIAKNEYKYVADLKMELGELPPVTCHANEIGQAVVNIVVNAAHAIEAVVKATGGKGVIAVKTWREGDSAVISVGDTGCGIPEDIRSRIFDPFFTTKEVGKGTGQGLAIAWSTVRERHGGQLTFESTVGQGTTFFIRLPIASK